jgi:hypothetical protein
MANWCNCELRVKGDEVSIQRFLQTIEPKRAGREDEDYEGYIIDTFVPPPQELVETTMYLELPDEMEKNFIARFGAAKLYDWRGENQGSFSADLETELESQEPGKLHFFFRTRSRPPLKAFRHISQLFPQLTFELDWEQFEMREAQLVRFVNGSQEVIEDRTVTTQMEIDECVAKYQVVLGPDRVFSVNGDSPVNLDEMERVVVAITKWLIDHGMGGTLTVENNPGKADPPWRTGQLPHQLVFTEEKTGERLTMGYSRVEDCFFQRMNFLTTCWELGVLEPPWEKDSGNEHLHDQEDD